MTFSGGDDNGGTIFQTNSTGSAFKSDFSFPISQNIGSYPAGKLIKASNGLLYGMTEFGGANGVYGLIFKYDISTGEYSDIHDFSGADGGSPLSNLTEVDSVSTGINQFSNVTHNVQVYPNPASKIIDIRMTLQQELPVQFGLFNMLGQRVWEENLGKTKQVNATVPVTNLANGVYILKVNIGSMLHKKEVIIAK